MEDCLSREQITKRGFFDPATVERIIASHQARTADHTDHLLALITFELWCRVFIDQSAISSAPAWAGEGVARG